jgi:hypothetical protein
MKKDPYPLTTRVLGHIRKQGWTEERKKMVLRVFGGPMRHETSCDASALLARAEAVGAKESVEQLVEYVRTTPREKP